MRRQRPGPLERDDSPAAAMAAGVPAGDAWGKHKTPRARDASKDAAPKRGRGSAGRPEKRGDRS